jgi:hypothetical protein
MEPNRCLLSCFNHLQRASRLRTHCVRSRLNCAGGKRWIGSRVGHTFSTSAGRSMSTPSPGAANDPGRHFQLTYFVDWCSFVAFTSALAKLSTFLPRRTWPPRHSMPVRRLREQLRHGHNSPPSRRSRKNPSTTAGRR